MNRQAAGRIETELRQRFPDREVNAGHVPGGLHIHISDTDGASSMVVITGGEPSAVLAMLMALPFGDSGARQELFTRTQPAAERGRPHP